MDKPLLATTVSKFRWSRLLFFAFLLGAFFTLFQFPAAAATEDLVGTNDAQTGLLRLHFNMGHLPDRMRIAKHFPGPNTSKADFARFCNEQTPTCGDVCRSRYERNHIVVPFCINSYQTSAPECWTTADMRCWGLDRSFWDGRSEWSVLEDDLNGECGISWIHFQSTRNPNPHLFVFGHGELEPFDNVELKFAQASRLKQSLASVPTDTAIVLSGHSMGAAWATYINTVLGREGKAENRRYMVGSGTPLVDQHWYWSRFRQVRGFSRFLLLGVVSNGHLLMDSKMIARATNGAIALPQHAFVCSMNYDKSLTCLDPQPETFTMSNTAQFSERTALEVHLPLKEVIHKFETYRECFQACIPYFKDHKVQFAINVEQFSKTIPAPSGYQRPQALKAALSGNPSRPPEDSLDMEYAGQLFADRESSAFTRPTPSEAQSQQSSAFTRPTTSEAQSQQSGLSAGGSGSSPSTSSGKAPMQLRQARQQFHSAPSSGSVGAGASGVKAPLLKWKEIQSLGPAPPGVPGGTSSSSQVPAPPSVSRDSSFSQVPAAHSLLSLAAAPPPRPYIPRFDTSNFAPESWLQQQPGSFSSVGPIRTSGSGVNRMPQAKVEEIQAVLDSIAPSFPTTHEESLESYRLRIMAELRRILKTQRLKLHGEIVNRHWFRTRTEQAYNAQTQGSHQEPRLS